jgi:large subunit ribosomal protein L29
MSKPAVLREQSDDQLKLSLSEQEHQLFRLRLQSETERLEAPSQIIHARREIARIKTILRERQIERERKASAVATAATTGAAPAKTRPSGRKK